MAQFFVGAGLVSFVIAFVLLCKNQITAGTVVLLLTCSYFTIVFTIHGLPPSGEPAANEARIAQALRGALLSFGLFVLAIWAPSWLGNDRRGSDDKRNGVPRT